MVFVLEIANASLLSSKYGLFAIDVLKNYFTPSTPVTPACRHLTREYYSQDLVRLISREIGLQLLIDIKNQPANCSNEGKALFNALWIIQLFHPQGGILFPSDRLDEIAEQLRINPIFSTGDDLREQCMLIMKTMQEEEFLSTTPEDYYDLENSFLCWAFHGKPTIPMTLVSIFCALADLCHIKARPIGFPGEVMAIVESTSNPGSTPLIVSVFHRKIPTLDEINTRFARALDEPFAYPLPVTPIKELVIRSARNMINSISRNPTASLNSFAMYVSVSILKILQGGAIHFMQESMINALKEQFPWDVKFFQRFPSSMTVEDLQMSLFEVKRRSSNSSPKFHVGKIFQHRRDHYWGVIWGWDLVCQASAAWQTQMAVDNLPRKASQPFYQALTSELSRQYVAEDNIDELAFNILPNDEEKQTIAENLCDIDDIGKYFSQIDIPRGQFLPNMELSREYPDDFASRN